MKEKLNSIFETLQKGIQDVIPIIVEEGKNTIDDIAKFAGEEWAKFKENIKSKPDAKVATEEVELLNAKKLVEFAKKYRVANANEVYAWKKQGDNAVIVNLAYGKDKEPLDTADNQYVIIKAEGLSADVMNLFKESELVILK